MKKRCWIYLFILTASLCACAKRERPVFADAETLARSVYAGASISEEGVYTEPIGGDRSYLLSLSDGEFSEMVSDAVCLRNFVDEKGRMLYAVCLQDGVEGEAVARAFFTHYDFAPCDPSEKMTVLAAGEYLVFFKSSAEEVEAAEDAFRRLMGSVDYESEKDNRS